MAPRFPRLIMKMRLAAARLLTPDVRLLSFERVNGKPMPAPAPGDHVDVHLPNGHVNQYSLCGPPEETDRYTIAIKKLPEGRGGSDWLHSGLNLGDIALVSQPRNHFPLERGRPHTILLAAGIGITPIASMAGELARTGARFELHYSTRTQDAPFAEELAGLCGAAKFRHHTGGRKHPGGLSLEQVLASAPQGTAVYCCGPQSYMDAVRAATASWPEEDVRFEAFQAPQDDGFVPAPATVQIRSTGETLHVAADESLLAVLNRKGFGTCEIGYLSGKVLHRDAVLGPKAHQRRMMPCVSRTNTTVVLDL